MDMILEDTPNVAPRVDGSGKLDAGIDPRSAVRARSGEYLTFRLGAEEYGIEILRVQEIRSYEPPTRIAGAPHFVRGVVNLRGVIVPVIDLRLKLQCDSADCGDTTAVIVLNVRGRVAGAVVDAVSDVIGLTPGDIKPAPELGARASGGFITGIGTCRSERGGANVTGPKERMLILLDIESLLAAADLGWGGEF
jgi:purine-binding chemotaxis protein CheW